MPISNSIPQDLYLRYKGPENFKKQYGTFLSDNASSQHSHSCTALCCENDFPAVSNRTLKIYAYALTIFSFYSNPTTFTAFGLGSFFWSYLQPQNSSEREDTDTKTKFSSLREELNLFMQTHIKNTDERIHTCSDILEQLFNIKINPIITTFVASAFFGFHINHYSKCLVPIVAFFSGQLAYHNIEIRNKAGMLLKSKNDQTDPLKQHIHYDKLVKLCGVLIAVLAAHNNLRVFFKFISH